MRLILQEDGLVKTASTVGNSIGIDTPSGGQRILMLFAKKEAFSKEGCEPVVAKGEIRVCRMNPKFNAYKPLNVPERSKFRKMLMLGKPTPDAVR